MEKMELEFIEADADVYRSRSGESDIDDIDEQGSRAWTRSLNNQISYTGKSRSYPLRGFLSTKLPSGTDEGKSARPANVDQSTHSFSTPSLSRARWADAAPGVDTTIILNSCLPALRDEDENSFVLRPPVRAHTSQDVRPGRSVLGGRIGRIPGHETDLSRLRGITSEPRRPERAETNPGDHGLFRRSIEKQREAQSDRAFRSESILSRARRALTGTNAPTRPDPRTLLSSAFLDFDAHAPLQRAPTAARATKKPAAPSRVYIDTDPIRRSLDRGRRSGTAALAGHSARMHAHRGEPKDIAAYQLRIRELESELAASQTDCRRLSATILNLEREKGQLREAVPILELALSSMRQHYATKEHSLKLVLSRLDADLVIATKEKDNVVRLMSRYEPRGGPSSKKSYSTGSSLSMPYSQDYYLRQPLRQARQPASFVRNESRPLPRTKPRSRGYGSGRPLTGRDVLAAQNSAVRRIQELEELVGPDDHPSTM
jgi:hypothetical protein